MRQWRWLPVVVLLAVTSLTLAPAGAAEAQTPKRGGVFHVPTPEAPSLDPHVNAGFVTHLYATPVYGGLVRFPAGPEARDSADHRILPDVAEKWEYTSPTTIVFTLRKGVRFHRKPPVNGREVTAEDVKFSLDRFRAKSPLRSRLEPVQSIDVLDRYTIRLVLREPFAPLLNHLANPAHCAIMPRELGDKDLTTAEAVIGTGPFVLRTYERGVRAIYDRNPDYQMPGLPYLDGLSLDVVPDMAARLSLLRAGKLELAHWWGWLTPEEGRALKRTNPEMVISTQMVMDVAHVYMRTDQPPFNDVRVRRAVALAIDRKAWRTSLHFGEGCLDSGPVPCAMTEWKVTADKMGMGPFGAGETDIDSFLYETFYSASPRNRSHVADPELDRMLIASRREIDPAKRREIVHEIQRYLADKVYYVYLPMWPRYIAHPPYVKGFKHIDGYSLGTRLMYVWFEK